MTKFKILYNDNINKWFIVESKTNDILKQIGSEGNILVDCSKGFDDEKDAQNLVNYLNELLGSSDLVEKSNMH